MDFIFYFIVLSLTFLHAQASHHSITFFSDPTKFYLDEGIESIHQSNTTTIVRNVGSNLVPAGTVPKRYSAAVTSSYPGIPAFLFQTAVEGITFSTKFNLPRNTYDVELGFVQVDECEEGQRIFHVFINAQKREESLDIFKTAGCSKALVLRYNSQIVDPILHDGIEISFETVSGTATLSYIRIRLSNKPCIPEVSTVPPGSEEDHYAHSVPGTYPAGSDPSFTDILGRGYFTVKIDGTGSHTHFVSGGYTAKIKSYVWTRVDTGKVISTRPKFSYNFPLGTTMLKLKVVDAICSEDEETTSITVTGRVQDGAVCYIYNDTGSILNGNALTIMPKPVLSFISSSLNIRFPFGSFRSKFFGARCIFLVKMKASSETKVSLDTSSTGTAHLYRGDDRIFDTSGGDPATVIATGDGHIQFEITYRYTSVGNAPMLGMKINGTFPADVSHDAATTLPIISTISPSSGSSKGGSEVRISGYNLYRPIQIFFGSTRAVVKAGPPLSTEVVAIAPQQLGEGVVLLRVQTGRGFFSNEVPFLYEGACDDVKFDVNKLVDKLGKDVVIKQPTAITIAHDGNLYVATIEGYVHKISYDHDSAVVEAVCNSEKFQDTRWKNDVGLVAPRAFLGITVDPRDLVPRPYVSASTIFYHRKEVPISISNALAWSNGAVERFKPATAATKARNPKQCLEHDKNIVSGLPVSNADHSVNQILFSQSGDLLIAIGGNTNMGLPNIRLGGSWEAYFSGAILVARLSKPGFDGVIPYTTPTNLRTAHPVGDYKDVDHFATGLRNPFAMTISRAGNVYVGDNGPNRGFGDAASSCSEYNETEAAKAPRMTTVNGGGAIFENGEFSAPRQDKILWIKEGKFYGHPNLQRSAILGIDECAYIDPLTGKTPAPGKQMPPINYEHRLALILSPVTGILEYGGNEFCGKLRESLIISKFKSLGTYAISKNTNGKTVGTPYKMNNFGGLSVVEDSSGSLIFPKYVADPTDGFFIFKPVVTNNHQLYLSGAAPFRHGKKGGSQLHIGGRAFTSSCVVSVGGKLCPRVKQTGTKITCTVPSHTGGPLSVDLSVKDGARSVVLKNAVLYMQV